MKYWKLASIATALTLSTSVNAEIISVDWQAAGDNLITRDTVSGLNWLDLTETNNMSFHQVVTELSVSGQFYGFRYATSAEVVTLWDNFGINLRYGGIDRSGTDNGIDVAASFLGNTLR